MTRTEEQSRAALERAQTGQSLGNYAAIFEGFTAKGIPLDDIRPRENVLTFDAWKACGRVVRKGEHGVRIVTVIEIRSKDAPAEAKPARTRTRRTTVFHISQTEPLDA